nr:hypothetical protein [Dietzia lutea]
MGVRVAGEPAVAVVGGETDVSGWAASAGIGVVDQVVVDERRCVIDLERGGHAGHGVLGGYTVGSESCGDRVEAGETKAGPKALSAGEKVL